MSSASASPPLRPHFVQVVLSFLLAAARRRARCLAVVLGFSPSCSVFSLRLAAARRHLFSLKALHDDIVSGKANYKDLASCFSDCSSAKCATRRFSTGRRLTTLALFWLRQTVEHFSIGSNSLAPLLTSLVEQCHYFVPVLTLQLIEINYRASANHAMEPEL